MGAGRRLACAAGAPALVLSCLAVLPVGAGALRRTPPRPDLVVRSISRPSRSTAVPGASFSVRVQVANAGRNPSRRSLAKVTLDTARGLAHPGSGWDVGSLRVPALRPRKRFSATAHLKVPNVQDIEGTFYADVCADADRKVKESNERNNCRASRTKITISQPAPPPLPVANSYPGLQGTGSLSFSSDPAVLNFQVVFNKSVDQIDLWVPRDVSAGVMSPAPSGCGGTGDAQQLNGQTYHHAICPLDRGAVGPNTPISGTLRTEPNASPGMGGYLYGSIDNLSSQGGPFTITGP